MLESILGYLFGVLNSYKDITGYEKEFRKKEMIRRGYLQKFKGHFDPDGWSTDEEPVWVEPEYRKRYVNVVQKDDKIFVNLSWHKNEKAIECIECEDQVYAEHFVKARSNYYSTAGDVVIENEGSPCFIYVFEYFGDITLVLSRNKYQEAYETIHCFDENEAKELLDKLKKHYKEYRHIDIKNELI